MYPLREFAESLNLPDQLPGCNIVVRCDRILIDAPDFRLDLYGWPDNRIVYSDKRTGFNTIKRYEHTNGEKCREAYYELLEMIGVDLTAIK